MFVILQVLIGNYEANCLELKKEKKKKLTTVRIEPGPDKKKQNKRKKIDYSENRTQYCRIEKPMHYRRYNAF